MSDDKTAARGALDAALAGDDAAMRQFHDLLLDLGYDPILAAAMADVARSLRQPTPPIRGNEPGHRQARDAGIVEPVSFVIPDDDVRAVMLLAELEHVEAGRPDQGVGWQPTGPLVHDEESRLWWMGRQDAEKLLRLEFTHQPFTLPALPAGAYWAVQWQAQIPWEVYLLVAIPVLAGEVYSGLLPPTKYTQFPFA